MFLATRGERGERGLKASDERGDPDCSVSHLLGIYHKKSAENAQTHY